MTIIWHAIAITVTPSKSLDVIGWNLLYLISQFFENWLRIIAMFNFNKQYMKHVAEDLKLMPLLSSHRNSEWFGIYIEKSECIHCHSFLSIISSLSYPPMLHFILVLLNISCVLQMLLPSQYHCVKTSYIFHFSLL